MSVDVDVDLDDERTWPTATRAWAKRSAAEIRAAAEYVADLPISESCDREFRQSIAGHKLVGYHCTRLLDHEVEDIRRRGVLLLDEHLVRQRIEQAVRLGHLNAPARAHAETKQVFATGHHVHREQQICCVMGSSIFSEDPDGVSPLLNHWGGEAIRGGAGEVAALHGIGTPSIVVVRIDLYACPGAVSFPSLAKVFAGKFLGLQRAFADVFHRASIPSHDVVDIWKPGDQKYDVFPLLPR